MIIASIYSITTTTIIKKIKKIKTYSYIDDCVQSCPCPRVNTNVKIG